MRGTINAFGTLFILALAAGCPLTDDPQAVGDDVDAAVDEGRRDDAGGGGDDSDPQGDDDGGSEPEMDGATDAGAGPGQNDAGHEPDEDAGAQQPSEDAATDTGKDDAGPDEQPDAGEDTDADAATEEPDAGQEPVAPDFGPAEMADDERAALIFNLVKSENYAETYAPFFETTSDIRPVVVSSHGGIVRVFQNDIARRTSQAWVQQNFPLPLVYPHGSIIVKQTYKTDATTQALVLSGTLIMAKIDTLDPAVHEGHWFFVRVSTSDVATRSASCVNCHNGRTATAVWPKDPEVPDDPGGKPDAIVPYDYMFVPFCRDPRNTQCDAP